jgi:hypothetical protein
MAIRVSIEGIGPATFPDGTADDVIDKAVKDLVASKTPDYSGPLGQFKKIADIANQERETGGKAVSTALEDPTGGNILRGIVGAAQWGFSPMTGLAKGAFRDPVEIVSRGLGAPEGVTKFAGDMAESADIMLPYGGLVKTAMATKKTVEAARAAESAAKSVKVHPKK